MTVKKRKMQHHIFKMLASCLLIATQATIASAQLLPQVQLLQDDPWCGDCCEHDLQFFAPVDFDLDCRPMLKDCGWYFGYEKLSWVITGERTTLGDPTVNVQSEVFLPQTGASTGTAPPTYQVINSVQDGEPDADFAWGNRYEFGRQNRGSGWRISILEGPELNTTDIYGFDELTILGTLPFLTRTDNDNNPDSLFNPDVLSPDLTVTLFPNGPNDVSTSINGFGSVAVNFRTPTGFLSGIRDYTFGPNTGPVASGPGRVIAVTGVTLEETNDVLTTLQITGATVTTIADGLPDDTNGDSFTFFFVDLDGDGNADPGEPFGFDFNDLHTFNVFFDTVIARNTTRTDGVELMHTFDVPNRHKMKKNQDSRLRISTGLRYFQLQDLFYFEGRGSILGLTTIATDTQNSIFGPQVQLQWHKQRGRFGLDVDGRFMWGFNVQDLDLDANIGQDLLPGGVNSSAIGRPTSTRTGRHDETFSPFVEFRADASYSITNSIKAKVGYTAMFIDNITRSSQVTDWVLPNPGLLKGGQQDIFINGVNFGFDVLY